MTDREVGTVARYMHCDLEMLPGGATVRLAAERMHTRGIGSVLVESVAPTGGEEEVAGIVTETDLVRKVLAERRDPTRTTVAEIMASPILTIPSDRPMLDASHLMEANHVRHLCVRDDDEIVGLISVRDLVRYFIHDDTGPVQALTDVYRPLSVLMNSALELIDSGETILAAAQQMTKHRRGSLLVLEAGELVGIVTERDLVRKVVAADLAASSTPVRIVMNSPLISIDINRTIRDASELMATEKVRHLTVREDHKVVGIVSVRDLVKMVAIRDKARFLHQPKE